MMKHDRVRLRRLSYVCYALAGIFAACACLPVKVLVDGVLLMVAPEMLERRVGGDMAGPAGLLLALLSGMSIVAGWTIAVLVFMAGRRLAARANRAED